MALVVPPTLLLPAEEAALLLPVFPLLWLASWAAGQGPVPRTPLDVPLLGIVATTLGSVFVTFDLDVSLPSIVGVVVGVSVYWATVRAASTIRGWWSTYLIFLCVGFGVALLGVVGTDWYRLTGKIVLLSSVTAGMPTRLTGLAGTEGGLHPNTVAGLLLLFLPSALAAAALLARHRQSLARRYGGVRVAAVVTLAVVGALWVVALFVFLQSRTAYGALLTTGILLGASFSLRAAGDLRRRIAAAVVTAVAAGALLTAVLSGGAWNGPGEGEPPGPGLLSVRTLEARVQIWKRGAAFVSDRPLTGIGMNTFAHLVHRRYAFEPAPWGDALIPSDEQIGHAHNVFLQAALDLGILGALAVFALYVITLVTAWKQWRGALVSEPPDGKAGPLVPFRGGGLVPIVLAALVAGLIAHTLFGLLDAVAVGSRKGLLFWLLLGLVMGRHAQSRDEP